MKKPIILCVLGVFIASITISPSYSQPVKDILNKMIEAQGGKAVIENIKDTTLTGDMEIIQMGITGSINIYSKEPNMMRIDAEVMGMVMTQAFDGENGWQVNPQTGSIEDMSEEQENDFKRQALGNDAFLHPEKYGITFESKGKETLEGKEYYILEQIFSDGYTATLFVDAKTYLLYKTKAKSTNQMGVEVDTESFISDYKKVEGVMIPHYMKVLQDGEEAVTMTFTEISFNTGLEDSFFKKSE
jgi:outer membrane lipoprotein-sorting protein